MKHGMSTEPERPPSTPCTDACCATCRQNSQMSAREVSTGYARPSIPSSSAKRSSGGRRRSARSPKSEAVNRRFCLMCSMCVPTSSTRKGRTALDDDELDDDELDDASDALNRLTNVSTCVTMAEVVLC